MENLNNRYKFRAWNKSMKMWIYFLLDEVYKLYESIWDWTDFENWCQSTGLLDKNGKEIYEDDVVECYQKTESIRGKIVFEEGCFFIKFTNGQKAWIGGAFKKFNPIIFGNVWENPELIK